MDISYIINHLGEEREEYYNAVSPPLFQTSNFCFKDVQSLREAISDEFKVSLYTRGINPTVTILRKKLAALEGAEDALVFSSGMAAISAAIMANVRAGSHVICVKNAYSWTNKLLSKLLSRFDVEVTFVDGTKISAFEQAIQQNTTLIMLESPTSFLFELQDLEAVSRLARQHGITTIMDNSYASPLYQQPLEHGIDIVAHTGTKYFGGHSDLLAGVLCSSRERIKRIFESEYMTLGGIISPHEAWLMIRSLRTLPVRMKQISDSTEKVATYLAGHSKVEKIHYIFSPEHPQQKLTEKYFSKPGGLFSIELKADSIQQMERFCNSLKRFLMAVSWGGHESLIFPACALYTKDSEPSLPFNLVRLYIGLEEPEALTDDLAQALEKI